MQRIIATALVALLVGSFGVTGVADAHQTDESEHHTEIDTSSGDVEQLLSISANDLAHHFGYVGHHDDVTDDQLQELREELTTYLDDNTGIRADDQTCSLERARFVEYPGSDGRVHYHQTYDCTEEPEEIEVANRVLLDSHAGYRHTAQIQVDGRVYATVFDQNYPMYAVYPESGEDVDAPAQPPPSDEEAAGDLEEETEAQQVSDDDDDSEATTLLAGLSGLLVVSAMVALAFSGVYIGRRMLA